MALLCLEISLEIEFWMLLTGFEILEFELVSARKSTVEEGLMFAIIESLGRQYKVSEGDIINLDRVAELNQDVPEGSNIIFTQVLMVSGDDQNKVGAPYLQGATVTAEIIKQDRDKKVIAFKKKRRKGYHKKIGFRRALTRVQIKEIKAA